MLDETLRNTELSSTWNMATTDGDSKSLSLTAAFFTTPQKQV